MLLCDPVAPYAFLLIFLTPKDSVDAAFRHRSRIDPVGDVAVDPMAEKIQVKKEGYLRLYLDITKVSFKHNVSNFSRTSRDTPKHPHISTLVVTPATRRTANTSWEVKFLMTTHSTSGLVEGTCTTPPHR